MTLKIFFLTKIKKEDNILPAGKQIQE